MKKFFKWTGIVLLAIIATLFLIIEVRHKRRFDAPYPSIQAVKDSAVIARGRQIIFGAAHCANCHAPTGREEDVTRGIEVPLSGGQAFDLPIGKIFTKNLTPDETGIGRMTDAEIARALRYGVAADGKALFDFMPFHNTSDEDLTAIISYLRSQPPVKNKVPENNLNL